MANEAAMAADCHKTIKTGSIRIEPKTICEADNDTGTNMLVHSVRFGVIEP